MKAPSLIPMGILLRLQYKEKDKRQKAKDKWQIAKGQRQKEKDKRQKIKGNYIM